MTSPQRKQNDLERCVKDTQYIQGRFQKLKARVNLKIEEGEGDDEQIMLEMKKFSNLIRVFQNAYFINENAAEYVNNCLSSMDSVRAKAGKKVLDPEETELEWAQVDRLSPPASPILEKRGSKKRKASSNDSEPRKRARPSQNKKRAKTLGAGTPVAAKIPSASKKEAPTWILASVVEYMSNVDKYKVQDEDVEGGSQIYKLDPSSVVSLHESTNYVYDKGSTVMAMFPDTTSFYPATVVRKVGDSVSVKFEDDENENGRTPSRKVESRHIFVLSK
eukprot:CAMPEP_0201522548 /NCGR_PEP_ID=MMETSP0161_2-20130828/18044_1 /ASSEMBLY_ACC=CAM_ASM_000251 /TAXON_ID=180227 /ORGANISM="Neoparamoeba aestuarina, Strain SoJaBio B1-5/56/2" /LENGTH=275 /DNA_ID=CAMNT_0047921431 /DNA_START=219 /DNA_END=1046 /DNA_ORIENTATION=-